MEPALKINNMDIGNLVDLYAESKAELKLMEDRLKGMADEIQEGESNIEIVGDKYRALVSLRETLTIPDTGWARFWDRVGPLKAKNIVKRETKTVYKAITAALKALLDNPQGDEDLQDGKKILKANLDRKISPALKVTEIKKDA